MRRHKDSTRDLTQVKSGPGIMSVLKRALVRGGLVGLLMGLLLVSIDLSGYMSRMSIFNRVELRMSMANAIDILQENEIDCNAAFISGRCTFDDIWRTYTIRFSDRDPEHRVAYKYFGYKHQYNSIIMKIIRKF